MKIGILTLHYGFNEGAILQAKALASLIEKLRPGASAEIVDHRYPGKLQVYHAGVDARRKALQSAIDHWLPLSRARFLSEDRHPTLEYCRKNYDCLIVGSDVVWSLRYQRRLRRILGKGILPRQRDPFFPAFPNVYWPEHVHSRVRIAYAASCGNLWWEDVPRTERKSMARILDGFYAIGYRDERTRLFLSGLSPELASRSQKVPDPTIAFDLIQAHGGEEAEVKLRDAGMQPDRPNALLIMKESHIAQAIGRMLKIRGFRLAATGSFGGLSDVDINELALSPLEWGWLPRAFQLCVTERMHATIFALLGGTPVLALDMNDRRADSRTKLQDLMEDVKLDSCYLHQDNIKLGDVEKKIDQLMSVGLDKKMVQSFLDARRREGEEFLMAALSSVPG